jgi:hypothetical protein
MIGNELRSAILIPGFSESARFVEGLQKELVDGPYASFDQVDVLLLGDALARPEKYAHAFTDRAVITHSAGIMAVEGAGAIVALNPPEPTPLHRTVVGATKIAFDKAVGAEEGIIVGGLFEPALELAKHPIVNAKIPFKIRNFSTVKYLIERAGQFPFGRQVYSFDQDQFGFHKPDMVSLANLSGIFARTLHGKHNHPMFQPRDTLKQIDQALGIYPS